MGVVTLAAACAVLAVVALTAAGTAPALLDGALRARTLTPRLGGWLVVVAVVLGALAGPHLARRVATALAGADGLPGGPATLGAAALVVVLVGARARGVLRPGTTALLLVLALVAAAAGAAGRGGAGSASGSVLAPVALPALLGPALAAAAALTVVVVLARVLRHATPEPVHRRSRALAVLSTAVLAVGAGTQTGQVGLGLVLLVTGGPTAGTLPVVPRLLVAAVVGLATAAALLRPRTAWRPLRRREPPAVLVADSCAAAVLLLAAAAGLPVPVLLVVLAARAGGDATRGLRAVEWPALVRR